MLSEETGAIVRATIPVVGASLDTIAARFYEMMFSDRPELLDGLFNEYASCGSTRCPGTARTGCGGSPSSGCAARAPPRARCPTCCTPPSRRATS
jgi:hypothetical protein